MLYAGPLNPPVIRQLLRINISLIVSVEFIQNAMLSFASAYLCGGLGMTRHMFSLSTAVYAGTAIIMIAQHHWLVSQLGYRRFIRYALLFFAVGALLCANAHTPGAYLIGRFIQAIGGSAFFTAARVHVQFFPPTPTGRGLAIRYMAYSLVGCSASAAFIAAMLLEHFSWRALFLLQFPQLLLIWWLSGKTVSNVRKQRRTGRLHPGNMLMLVSGVFILQWIIENMPYDLSEFRQWLLLVPPAGIALAWFIWREYQRHHSLLPFRHLFTSRYLMGLFYYGICYLALSSVNYLLPIFLQQGMGFPVLNCGIVLSGAGLSALLFTWLHLRMAAQYPHQKHFLFFAFSCLALFGWLCSRFTPQTPLFAMLLPLVILSGFTAIGQGTAALNTFRETDIRIFSQAYQTKNMLRELMNSTGVTLTNVVLQHREALHYTRLAEQLTPQTSAASSLSLSQLVSLTQQQVTVLASQDLFMLVGVASVLLLLFSVWQRRII
ncbi:MFS transporter [Tolumonas lignilytica]|uniref:MFS transporter n=1 Tax=Tolumonas lignilytica TaxID=1283284 RepID=UPI000464F4C5|nr:MFS transporter [Tolumonas lignilytica]